MKRKKVLIFCSLLIAMFISLLALNVGTKTSANVVNNKTSYNILSSYDLSYFDFIENSVVFGSSTNFIDDIYFEYEHSYQDNIYSKTFNLDENYNMFGLLFYLDFSVLDPSLSEFVVGSYISDYLETPNLSYYFLNMAYKINGAVFSLNVIMFKDSNGYSVIAPVFVDEADYIPLADYLYQIDVIVNTTNFEDLGNVFNDGFQLGYEQGIGEEGVSGFLVNSASAFLDFEIFPNFSLANVLWIIVAFGLLFFLLKIFFGG